MAGHVLYLIWPARQLEPASPAGAGDPSERRDAMKMTVEIDCTPEEARRFMGLPDVEQANAAYVETMSAAMKGVSNTDQLERYARQLAPMGQFGLKLFQDFMDSAVQQRFRGSPAVKSTERPQNGE